jgi:hypothetical protein
VDIEGHGTAPTRYPSGDRTRLVEGKREVIAEIVRLRSRIGQGRAVAPQDRRSRRNIVRMEAELDRLPDG